MKNTNFEVADFYDRIKTLCKEQNKTQSELCSYIQCPLQNFRNKITRKTYPQVIDTILIAKFLGTTVEYLVTGEAPEKKEIYDKKNILQEKLDLIAKIATLTN